MTILYLKIHHFHLRLDSTHFVVKFGQKCARHLVRSLSSISICCSPRFSENSSMTPFPGHLPLCIRRRLLVLDSGLHVARKRSLKSTKNATLVKTLRCCPFPQWPVLVTASSVQGLLLTAGQGLLQQVIKKWSLMA